MHRARPNFEVNGEAIRRIRMAAGVEINEMAARAGISPRYLSHLETGSRRHPKPGPYTRLRNALNATDEELLTPHEEPPPKE